MPALRTKYRSKRHDAFLLRGDTVSIPLPIAAGTQEPGTLVFWRLHDDHVKHCACGCFSDDNICLSCLLFQTNEEGGASRSGFFLLCCVTAPTCIILTFSATVGATDLVAICVRFLSNYLSTTTSIYIVMIIRLVVMLPVLIALCYAGVLHETEKRRHHSVNDVPASQRNSDERREQTDDGDWRTGTE